MGIPGGYAALGEQWLRTFDVRLKKPASGLHGRAFPKTRDLVVPWPTNTRKRLYILAHEIAHVVLDHKRQRPAYVQEFEAETFAHGLMRLFGIRVPRKMTVGAQQYVRRKILARPQRRFAHWIDPTIAEWAGLYGLNYKAPPGKPKNYHQTSIRRVEAALAAVPVARGWLPECSGGSGACRGVAFEQCSLLRNVKVATVPHRLTWIHSTDPHDGGLVTDRPGRRLAALD